MASFSVGVRLSWDRLEVGIALPTKPSGEGEPWAELQGGIPSKLSGTEVEAVTQCCGSLMTQAWAGDQTDIFSEEKLL